MVALNALEGVRENMAGKSDIILTTSSSLDGWTVEDYLDTVSAHVVAGANLFRDVFAGLSDVFGGRSQAYQKELTAINDEALKRRISLRMSRCSRRSWQRSAMRSRRSLWRSQSGGG